ncbi:hypothetical protein [Caviibacterium pharyngocola]|uniref:Uncharacterized protein n=1 Tax=Caviibacterium pharyngocola TaxID=28159 RepID=A0A2M8RU31_9PAST|nr:hypothetical protein [Caviibacterium pharyngocola]PJG82395.1 hypothetical protein CVP04_08620 [Caviibacterium pharyngocola]
MSESHLVSQLAKLIERSYKEKAIVSYQIAQLNDQLNLLGEQIQSFEKTLGYLDPHFDFKSIRKVFDAERLVRKQLFEGSIQQLIAEVFKRENHWRTLHSLTSDVMKLDKGLQSGYRIIVGREHQYAVGNALRKLYKQGIIEREETYLHHKAKRRGIFARSKWRIKAIEA